MRLRTDRMIDLSQPVFHDCPAWAEYDPPNVSRNYRRDAEGFNAETVRLNTHSGTHVDVPFHFFDDRRTIGQTPIEAFAGPARFLDLRGLPADTAIGSGELAPVAGALEPGDFAVLVTGWGAKRDISVEYLTAWPYLGGDGARFLADREVAGVGIDALSIGGWGGPEKGEPSHTTLLGAEKVIIEGLRIPDELLGDGRWYLTAFPMLLQGCGGAWTRAVTWEIDE